MALVRPPVFVRRAGYRAAHALLRAYWSVAHPHTVGVKCVVREGDAILLVRHAYRDRRAWELPGGGMKRGEEPAQTAAREAREELGLDLRQWRALGRVDVHNSGKSTTLICFEGRPAGRHVAIDHGELDDARWFELARPPRELGVDARAILADLLGCDVAAPGR